MDGVYENGNPKTTYREIRSQDARGNVTGEKLGAGVLRTARTFDAKTGRITGITSKMAAQERQEFGYTWDVLGNLTTRTDTSGSNTTTTLYVGSVEKVTHSGSLYEYKRYIAGGAALITEKHETTVNNGVSTETETETAQYLLKDHLGSVAVIGSSGDTILISGITPQSKADLQSI